MKAVISLVLPLVVTVSAVAQSSFPLNMNAGPRYYSNYSDLQVRCSSYVSDIESMKRAAQGLLRGSSSNFKKAAQILNDVLQAKAAQIGNNYGPMANPHTVEAIVQAAKLSRLVIQQANANSQILGANTELLKVRVIGGLVDFVLRAYDLDKQYFFSHVNNCRSCYTSNPYDQGWLPESYYSEMGQLAVSLLDTYQSDARLLAKDSIEISMVAQFSNSAAEILASSLLRRDYACAVTRLVSTSQFASSLVGSSAEDQYMAIEELRQQIGWAKSEIVPHSRCGQ